MSEDIHQLTEREIEFLKEVNESLSDFIESQDSPDSEEIGKKIFESVEDKKDLMDSIAERHYRMTYIIHQYRKHKLRDLI